MIRLKTDKVLYEVIGVIDGRLKLNAIKQYCSVITSQKPSFKMYRDIEGVYINISFYYNNKRVSDNDKVYITEILKEFVMELIPGVDFCE